MTVEAGLPDHDHITHGKGIITDGGVNGYLSNSSKSFSGGGAALFGATASTPNTNFRTGDANESNNIYGNSNTVQQEAIQYPYFIQIATGSETKNNIINDIELNNPYSLFDSKYSDHELNNLSWLKSEGQWNAKAVYPTAYDKLLKVYNGTETVEGLSVKLSTETYTDYDFVLNTAEETFRLPFLDGSEDTIDWDNQIIITFNSSLDFTAPSNGVVFFRAENSSCDLLDSDGNTIEVEYWYSSTWSTTINPILKGQRCKYRASIGSETYVKIFFCPYKGTGSLYFYVGETVQNANLIDAGRIGEQLVGKADIDLTNTVPSTTFIQQSVSWGIPDYSTGVVWSVTAGATFTAPYDCVVFHTEGFKNGASSQYYFNGSTDYAIWSRSDGDIWTIRTTMYSLKKGDFVKGFNAADGNRLNKFIYYKFSGQSN